VTEPAERRTNIALRQRIDQLLGRVRAARAEIVERGLGAVEKPPPSEDSGPDPPAPPADAANGKA
jgi:hypothetical protein